MELMRTGTERKAKGNDGCGGTTDKSEFHVSMENDNIRSYNESESEGDSDEDYIEDVAETLPAEELIIISDDLPDSLENLLLINKLFQQSITNCIQKLDLSIAENHEKQEILQDELDNTAKRKKQGFGALRIERPVTVFCQPYFKDKKGFAQPANEDWKQKQATQEIGAYQRQPSIWLHTEKARLVRAVKSTALKNLLKPFMNKKELLNAKDQNSQLTDEEKKELKEKLEEVDKEIKKIRKLSDAEIFGPRTNCHDWMKISVVDFEGTRSPKECELYWKHCLHPSIKHGKWSKVEQEKLKFLMQKHQNNWDLIASELKTNRTAQQCIEHYQSELNDVMLKSKWTPEEDAMLIKVIESCRIGDYIPWHQIFYYMEGRTQLQVMRRWMNTLDPAIKKGKWSEEEDLLLLATLLKYGSNWSQIKQYLPGRTDCQCRDRWLNCLSSSVSFKAWTPEEDTILMNKVELYGPKWSRICRYLPGRTDSMVAKRYSCIMNAGNDDKNNTDDKEFVRPKSCTGVKTIEYRNNIYKKFKFYLQTISKKTSSETEDCGIEQQQDGLPFSVKNKSDIDSLIKRFTLELKKKQNVNRNHTGRPMVVYSLEDLEMFEIFKYIHHQRGRPVTKAPLDETNSEYSAAAALFLQAFGSTIKRNYFVPQEQQNLPFCPYLKNAEVPFLPPTLPSLFAFKNLLLNRNMLLQSTKMPLEKKHGHDSPQITTRKISRLTSLSKLEKNEFLFETTLNVSSKLKKDKFVNFTEDENFHMLLSRFVAVFFWPALLSTVTPVCIPEEPRPKKKAFRSNRVRRKLKKPWVAEAIRRRKEENNKCDGTTESHSVEVPEIKIEPETLADPNVKRRGRPRGFRPKKKEVPSTGQRRSSRLKLRTDETLT